MALRLHPDPAPALVSALATLLETEGVRLERGPAYSVAWRRQALRERVAKPHLGSGATTVDPSYVAAPWPRRMRGATRA